MSEARLRDELCRVGPLAPCARLRARNDRQPGRPRARRLSHPHTDACLGDLDPAALDEVDAAGHGAGRGAAEQDAGAASPIYAAAAEAAASSAHSARSWRWASRSRARLQAIITAPITPYCVEGRPRAAARLRAAGRSAVADRVAAAIEHAERLGMPIRAVVLHRGSGPNVPGRNAGGGDGARRGARGNSAAWLEADPKPAPLSPSRSTSCAVSARAGEPERRNEMPRFRVA